MKNKVARNETEKSTMHVGKRLCYIITAIDITDKYKKHLADVCMKLESEGYAILNPLDIKTAVINVRKNPQTKDSIITDKTIVGLTMVAIADTVYVMNDWDESFISQREWEYAVTLGKQMIEEQ